MPWASRRGTERHARNPPAHRGSRPRRLRHLPSADAPLRRASAGPLRRGGHAGLRPLGAGAGSRHHPRRGGISPGRRAGPGRAPAARHRPDRPRPPGCRPHRLVCRPARRPRRAHPRQPRRAGRGHPPHRSGGQPPGALTCPPPKPATRRSTCALTPTPWKAPPPPPRPQAVISRRPTSIRCSTAWTPPWRTWTLPLPPRPETDPLRHLLLALALVLSTLAHADLTPAQRTTLAADIQADPVLSQLPPSSDAANQIVAAYAAPASPAYVVWRSSLTTELARAAIVSGATQMDALTVGKRETLLYLCGQTLNAADPAVRAAIDDLTGSQATLKAALVAARSEEHTSELQSPK